MKQRKPPADLVPSDAAPPLSRGARAFETLLLALLIVGVICRFYGLNWDEGAMLHPDERFITDVVTKIGLPSSWSQWFDATRSPLNPDNIKGTHYVYGQWPLLLGKLVALASGRGDAPSLVPILRGLSALFDTFTIGLTWLWARRVLPRPWPLFAATLVAVTALHVQQSHYFTVDNFAAFWILASVWAATRWQNSGRAREALLAGACVGLALSCKISAIFVALPLLLILIYGARKFPARQSIAGALGLIVVALLFFRVFNAMAFRGEWGFFDWRFDARFAGDLAQQAAITRGEVDVPFNVQWIGRAPWLFSARNLGFWGYGWGILISGALGIVLVWWETMRRKRDKLSIKPSYSLLVAAMFCLFLFGVQGAEFSKFTRYFLPMTPFLALLSAEFWRRAARRRWLHIGAVLTAIFTALWCVAVTSVYGRQNTRLAASEWIRNHIAPGTPVANETPWDDELPISWLAAGDGQLKRLTLNSYDTDTPQKRDDLLKTLDEAQWIFQSSGRSWQNIPRWQQKWPMTSALYFALWSGELGFTLEREWTSYPRLGPLQFPDDDAEEALSVYDHPRVLLWKKNASYSRQKAEIVLYGVDLPPERGWVPREAKE